MKNWLKILFICVVVFLLACAVFWVVLIRLLSYDFQIINNSGEDILVSVFSRQGPLPEGIFYPIFFQKGKDILISNGASATFYYMLGDSYLHSLIIEDGYGNVCNITPKDYTPRVEISIVKIDNEFYTNYKGESWYCEPV